MNFMIIRRFFIDFADFLANFCVFFTIILFNWLKWVVKKPLLLEQIYDNNWLHFLWVRIIFLLRNMTKKWRKSEPFFSIFCGFSFFSVFS